MIHGSWYLNRGFIALLRSICVEYVKFNDGKEGQNKGYDR